MVWWCRRKRLPNRRNTCAVTGTSVKEYGGNKKLRDLGCAAILIIPAVSLASAPWLFLPDQNGAQKFPQASSPGPLPSGEQKSLA